MSTQKELYDFEAESIADEKPWHDQQRMEELYIDKGLSTYDLADRFDVSRTTISYWMAEHGISTRGRTGRTSAEEHVLHVHLDDRTVYEVPVAGEIEEIGTPRLVD